MYYIFYLGYKNEKEQTQAQNLAVLKLKRLFSSELLPKRPHDVLSRTACLQVTLDFVLFFFFQIWYDFDLFSRRLWVTLSNAFWK